MSKKIITSALIAALLASSMPVYAMGEEAAVLNQLDLGSQPNPYTNSLEADANIWNNEDFVVEEDVLYGFSEKGVEKLKDHPMVILPSEDENGRAITRIAAFAFSPNKKQEITDYEETHDVDGYEIKNIGNEFTYALRGVHIPEGYKVVGQDAFNNNPQLEELSLPSSLEHISEYGFGHTKLGTLRLPKNLKTVGDNAFFDAGITGKLIIPSKVQSLGERSFKANKITELEFRTELLTVIAEQIFEDNSIQAITIPNSVKEIQEAAFGGNPGDEKYAGRVVIWTKNNNASQIKNAENYYIDPTEDKKTTPLDIDYSKWELSDFKIAGETILGFSQEGEMKVKKNKNLIIPEKNRAGETIRIIGKDAFRNVELESSSYKLYNLETVELPATIETIEDFAFQSNEITEVTITDDQTSGLKKIGQGAFMNNKLTEINFIADADNLKMIDNAAFFINNIRHIIIPENVEVIGFSAFRQSGADQLFFMGEKLQAIEEMAFLGNHLSEVTLPENIKTIGVQAFLNNAIERLTLPESLERIEYQAFAINKLNSIQLPKNVEFIAFNAFTQNPGETPYGKVVIHTDKQSNPKQLPDGEHYLIDPASESNKATDRSNLNELLEKVEKLDLSALRPSTKKQYEDMIKEGKELIKDENLTKSAMKKFVEDGNWFLTRVELDKKMRYVEDTLAKYEKSSSQDKKNLQGKFDYAKTAYNNKAVEGQKLKRLEKELKNLADLVNGTGDIAKAKMMQGTYYLDSPLPIPGYHIGVNVYYDEAGTILYVLDMSYTIGEGQLDEYGQQIENVDEDNQGYHELALPTLDEYEGKDIRDIARRDFSSMNIPTTEKNKYHVEGLYKAVQNAAQDAIKMLDEKKPEEKKPPVKQTRPESPWLTGPIFYKPMSQKKEKPAEKKSDAVVECRFTDVNATDWFAADVEYVVKYKLMVGTSESTFVPQLPVNRAMAAQVLYNMAGQPQVKGEMPFHDVQKGTWYEEAVKWAVENQITKGVDVGRFAPDDPLTREQLVTLLYNYAKMRGVDTGKVADIHKFKDQQEISPWAEPGMKWAIEMGIIKGTDNQELQPREVVDRAQLAAILQRYNEMMKTKGK